MKKNFRVKNPAGIPQHLVDEDNKSPGSTMCLKAMMFVGVLIIAQYVISQIIMRGYHRTVFPHYTGRCRNVSPLKTGSEDIAITSDGLAFITSGIKLFHKLVPADSRIMNFEGRIYLFDFNHPEKPAKKLRMVKLPQRKDFAPQGISIWEDKDGGHISVLVVNHRLWQARDTVEIFSFDRNTLILHHKKTVINEFFRSLNDIAATGPSSFYVTNDGHYTFSPLRLLERFGMFPWGDVLHVNNDNALKVLNKMYEVSGIALSSDGRYVFIASPYGQDLHVYSRGEDDKLTIFQKINLGTAPDDITIDSSTGDLIVSCFQYGIKSLNQLYFKERGAAQVLRLTSKSLDPDKRYIATRTIELFADDGELISQSSTAVVYGDALLIGSVTDRTVYCT
ncbi:putative serum paraoxonase/arylesterase 1-like [Apostichopus japonicus]|uniref:Paraoxonase n=1 Tax=Stichopus japonicus TaxID=307972 RepID=A0A2G8LDX8_STIJA|nr:putative serum paraoxonase/arylesterase 1-like [Apostichopus japonicus]